MTINKQEVMKYLEHLKALCAKSFPSITPPSPDVIFSLYGRNRYGYVHFERNVISLHKGLYLELGKEFLDDVLVHEYVHAVAHLLYPDDRDPKTGKRILPHGKEFYEILNVLGNKERKDYEDTEYMRNLRSSTKNNNKLHAIINDVDSDKLLGSFDIIWKLSKEEKVFLASAIEKYSAEVAYPLDEKYIDDHGGFFSEHEINDLLSHIKNGKSIKKRFFWCLWNIIQPSFESSDMQRKLLFKLSRTQ